MRPVHLIVLLLLALAMIAGLLLGCRLRANKPSDVEASDNQQPTEETQGNQAAQGTYRSLSAAQAKTMMDESSQYIIVDVRSDEEYQTGHLVEAILIPHDQIASRAISELPDQDALIFVYCRSGGRSKMACEELVSLGYTNVYDIGGIINWPYEIRQD